MRGLGGVAAGRAVRTESGIDQARQLLGGRWTVVVGLVVASAVFGLTQALILAIVAEAAGALVDHAHLVHIAVGPVRLAEPVGTLLYLGIGVCAVALLLQIPLSILPARMSSEVQAQMQRDLFAAYTRASWAEQASDREGHLQELITNQALQAAWITASATQLVTAGLTLAVLMASAILLNPEAAGLVFAAGIIVFAVLRPVHHLVSKFASAQSLAQMELASGIGQASRLAEETHVFGVADAQRRRFEHLVDSVRRMYFRAQAVAKFSQGAYQGLIYLLAVAGLIAISASHAGSVASLGAVVLLLVRAGSYSLTVQGSYQGIRAALPFVARVRETEHRYQRSARVGGQLPLSEIRSLGFEEVSFGYRPRRRVLTDVSFTVRQGEAIGVVGPSGVGKTTLVQLLLQLRAPDTGRYVVNDEVASNYLRTDWERCVSYVPQEPRLLHATVADNIRYFRPLTDAAVHRAARLARIDDDILEWSQGYETLIGPRADAVSGGQQQRLCIARALATQPAVLVLDEPTSALDPRSEGLLQESLHDLRGSVTLFVIAHRMSTLTICDRVIVLVGGQVESFDTPDELRRSSSYYRAATDIRDRGTETRPHLQSH